MKFCKLEDCVSRRPIDGFAAMSDTTRGGVAGGAAGGATPGRDGGWGLKFCKLEDRVSRRPIDGFASASFGATFLPGLLESTCLARSGLPDARRGWRLVGRELASSPKEGWSSLPKDGVARFFGSTVGAGGTCGGKGTCCCAGACCCAGGCWGGDENEEVAGD